jgi:hypothetical protein
MRAKIDIVIDGKKHHFDFAPELEIGPDLDEQMDKIAAQIGWTGEIWGEAKRAVTLVDAEYRQWRAQESKKLLDADPKMPEWKVKAAIESSPGFMKHKEAIAQTQRDEVTMATVVNAFKHKSEQLRSRGAAIRTELEATGMNTRTKADRETAVRSALGKTRRKA